MCDLKVAKMNVKHSLIWKIMLYDFEQVDRIKNIYCVKGEGAVRS